MADIDRQMEAPGFWDAPAASAPLLKRRRSFERRLATLNRLREDADELAAWQELVSALLRKWLHRSQIAESCGDWSPREYCLAWTSPPRATTTLLVKLPAFQWSCLKESRCSSVCRQTSMRAFVGSRIEDRLRRAVRISASFEHSADPPLVKLKLLQLSGPSTVRPLLTATSCFENRDQLRETRSWPE